MQDVFRFTSAGLANADTIYDFEHNIDKIDLTNFGSTFAAVSFINQGGNANVYLNGQLIATVIGAASVLTSNDFIFSSPAPTNPELAPLFDDGVAPMGEVYMAAADLGGSGEEIEAALPVHEAAGLRSMLTFGPALTDAWSVDLV